MLRNCVPPVQNTCICTYTYSNITMNTIQNTTCFMYPSLSSYVVRNFSEKLGWHDNVNNMQRFQIK